MNADREAWHREYSARVAEACRWASLSIEERNQIEEQQRRADQQRRIHDEFVIWSMNMDRRARGLAPLGSDGPALITFYEPGKRPRRMTLQTVSL